MKTRFTLTFLITFLVMFNTVQAFHPASDSTVIITPHWQKGEIKKYEIVNKTKVSFYSTTIISEITQVVTDVNDTCIELEWRYDTVKQIDSMPYEPGQSQKPSKQILLKGKTIKYRTDLFGRITRILNFNELSKQVKPAVDTITPSFMRSLMPQYFASFLLKDLLTFHRIYGQQLKSADTTTLLLKYSIKPGIQIPSRSISTNFKHKNLHPGIGLADDLVSVEGRSLELVSASSDNSFTYEFRISTGWLTSFTSVMHTTVHDNLITDSCEIRLLP